jgi:hypothetical protein
MTGDWEYGSNIHDHGRDWHRAQMRRLVDIFPSTIFGIYPVE